MERVGELFKSERTLVPVGGGLCRREGVFVDANVEFRRENARKLATDERREIFWMFLQFTFADEGDSVQNFGGVCLRKVVADFFDEVVGDSDHDDVLHELVVAQNFFNPASAT